MCRHEYLRVLHGRGEGFIIIRGDCGKARVQRLRAGKVVEEWIPLPPPWDPPKVATQAH